MGLEGILLGDQIALPQELPKIVENTDIVITSHSSGKIIVM